MALRTIDGSVVTASAEILDEDDTPVLPKAGYPKVALLDTNKDVLVQVIGMPGATAGTWTATITLPLMGVKRSTEYKLRWRLLTPTGEKFQVFETLTIDPKADRRDSEIVAMDGDTEVEFVMPIAYDPSMNAAYQVYQNNVALLPNWLAFTDPSVKLDAGLDRTVVTIPVVDPAVLSPSLFANLVSVRARIDNRPRTWQYKYWFITPQIALAMSHVEDFLNKSRIENVIPELEYTPGDLVGYLERGLNMFNSIQTLTAFNGLNMQGPILDSWLICSTYWALGAQLMAEGSLAFDFSGQGISLNVDRTPQLDSALGRIEARIQDTVVPLKKMLAQQGIINGDGSVGKTDMHNPRSSGTLGLINSPTTRIGGWANLTTRRVW